MLGSELALRDSQSAIEFGYILKRVNIEGVMIVILLSPRYSMVVNAGLTPACNFTLESRTYRLLAATYVSAQTLRKSSIGACSDAEIFGRATSFVGYDDIAR